MTDCNFLMEELTDSRMNRFWCSSDARCKFRITFPLLPVVQDSNWLACGDNYKYSFYRQWLEMLTASCNIWVLLVACIMSDIHCLFLLFLSLTCFLYSFYPRDAMLARVIAIATCPSIRLSICPSVCLSRAGIVSKRRKLAAWFLHHLVAPRL